MKVGKWLGDWKYLGDGCFGYWSVGRCENCVDDTCELCEPEFVLDVDLKRLCIRGVVLAEGLKAVKQYLSEREIPYPEVRE
jgi:hypothetical protein